MKGISVRNFFIGLMMLDAHFVETEFDDLLFQGCGISILTYKMERIRVGTLHFIGCVAGWVNGGQWRQRADNYSEAGGWADKGSYEHVTGQSFVPMNDSTGIVASLDGWFDDNFFKTGNNTTRKYPVGGSGTPATTCPYRGISGRSISFLSRYLRPNASNTFISISHMNSSRPAFEADGVSTLSIEKCYLENVGYANGQNSGDIVGAGTVNDPYISGRYKDPVFGWLSGIQSPILIRSLESQRTAAISASPAGQALVSVDAIRKFGTDETSATNAGSYRPTTFVDAGLESVTGSKTWSAGQTWNATSTWNADQTANGHLFGDQLASQWVATSTIGGNSVATQNVTLPGPGTYLLTVWTSGNGQSLQAAIGTFLVNAEVITGTDYLCAVQQLGTTKRAAGSYTPDSITVAAPASNLTMDVTSTKNGTGLVTQLYIRVRVVRIS